MKNIYKLISKKKTISNTIHELFVKNKGLKLKIKKKLLSRTITRVAKI
jgi:hypothetical protein